MHDFEGFFGSTNWPHRGDASRGDKESMASDGINHPPWGTRQSHQVFNTWRGRRADLRRGGKERGDRFPSLIGGLFEHLLSHSALPVRHAYLHQDSALAE